jgi:hypothetical protein
MSHKQQCVCVLCVVCVCVDNKSACGDVVMLCGVGAFFSFFHKQFYSESSINFQIGHLTAMEIPIEDCASARAYKPSAARKGVIYAFILALYCVSIPFCYRTAGEPRATAMAQAQKLADEKWMKELQGQVDEELALDLATEKKSETNILSHPEDAEFAGDLKGQKLFGDNAGQQAASGGWLASWMGPSKEQRRAEKELKQFEKEFKEKSLDPPSLPPAYLPSAWAVLALMATFTVHALFFLLCRWIPAFKASSLFSPATSVTEGCFVLVVPPENRGKADIVRVMKSTADMLQIEFQRQKYFYVPSSRLASEIAAQFPNGLLKLSSCPVDLPLSQYLTAGGIRTDADVLAATELWGKNHLAVHIPSFLELLKNQLLSPLSMFQVCVYTCIYHKSALYSLLCDVCIFVCMFACAGVLRDAVASGRVLDVHYVDPGHGSRLRGLDRVPEDPYTADAR